MSDPKALHQILVKVRACCLSQVLLPIRLARTKQLGSTQTVSLSTDTKDVFIRHGLDTFFRFQRAFFGGGIFVAVGGCHPSTLKRN